MMMRLGTILAGMAWPLAAWAQEGSRYYGGHMWDGGGAMWLFGPLMMIVFLAVAVVVVVLLVRWLGGAGHHGAQPPGGGRALDILRERFARGEIDKAEFEERRRLLDG